MSDLTQPITNPELAQAVADMAAQGSRASREAVLDIVISKARFLAPVTISPAPEQQESAPLGEGTAIQFQLLPNQEGQPFFPAFTCWEELRKLGHSRTGRETDPEVVHFSRRNCHSHPHTAL